MVRVGGRLALGLRGAGLRAAVMGIYVAALLPLIAWTAVVFVSL